MCVFGINPAWYSLSFLDVWLGVVIDFGKAIIISLISSAQFSLLPRLFQLLKLFHNFWMLFSVVVVWLFVF